MTASADIRLLTAGAPLDRARGAVVLLHGRGGTAQDILSLADALGAPDLAWLAPQAPGHNYLFATPYSPFAPATPCTARRWRRGRRR